jgi:hypothetical protein
MPRPLLRALAPSLFAALCACGDARGPAPEESKPAGASPAAAPGLGSATSGDAKPAAPVATKGTVMLKVGDPAPAFKAKDHTGQTRSLADYRGKRVVLWFYPKASTGG